MGLSFSSQPARCRSMPRCYLHDSKVFPITLHTAIPDPNYLGQSISGLNAGSEDTPKQLSMNLIGARSCLGVRSGNRSRALHEDFLGEMLAANTCLSTHTNPYKPHNIPCCVWVHHKAWPVSLELRLPGEEKPSEGEVVAIGPGSVKEGLQSGTMRGPKLPQKSGAMPKL